MKIALDYGNPTPTHCDVAVFVNGALAGVLNMRQEGVDEFQHVIKIGLHTPGDSLSARRPRKTRVSTDVCARLPRGRTPRRRDRIDDLLLDSTAAMAALQLSHMRRLEISTYDSEIRPWPQPGSHSGWRGDGSRCARDSTGFDRSRWLGVLT